MSKETAMGFLGGVVSGALTSYVYNAMQKKEALQIVARSEYVGSTTIAGETLELHKKYYKLAILHFNNGTSGVNVEITVGDKTYSMRGDEEALLIVADANVSVVASGSGLTPEIQIIYMEW